MPGEEFDWTNTEDNVVVEQCSVAVYRNGNGHIVIRGHATSLDHEDQIIVLTTAAAMRSVAGALMVAADGEI